MSKKYRGRLIKSIVYLSVFALVLYSSPINVFLNFTSEARAVEPSQMCQVAVDVVLIMDVSGSMADGAALSQCDWENLEWVGLSMQCVGHSQQGLTEPECLAKPDVPQCDSPIFTPATLSKIDSAKNAANSFLNNMGLNDQSGLISFSDSVSLDKPLSSDHPATQTAVNSLSTGGATNIGDAIDAGIQELNSNGRSQAVKAIILLTDGKATKPNGDGIHENAADVQYAIDRAGIAAGFNYKIFTIGLGSHGDINQTMLQTIASTTGAQYYHAQNGDDLSGIYNQIAFEVCQFGSISGCKYNDLNNNNQIDQGEPTLNGWEINLNNGISTTTQTVVDGCYTFAGLADGDYTITETLQPDWAQTYPVLGFHSVTISGYNNVIDKDFANYFPSLPIFQCSDGIDNDSDQLIDDLDPGCYDTGQYDPTDNDENDTLPECSDNFDNDSDGEIDFPQDDGCTDAADNDETDMTQNGINPGDVVINELMWMGSNLSYNDEWIELFNTTQKNIDLSGCQLTRLKTGAEALMLTIPNGQSILSQNYFLISNYDKAGSNIDIDPELVDQDVVLTNSDLQVKLYCGGQTWDDVNSILIDTADDGNGAPLAGDNTNKKSMSRKSPAGDGTQATSWCTAGVQVNWDPGTTEYGTPGAVNVCEGEEPPTTGTFKLCKWEDLDGDEQTINDQNPVPDWLFSVSSGTATSTATTTLAGCATFELEQGLYTVYEEIQEGWYLLNQSSQGHAFQLNAGQTTQIDFYNTQFCSIAGYKYRDSDNNTSTDEYLTQPVSGWEISLFDGTATTTALTNQDGYYEFTELLTGDYTLSESLCCGWMPLTPSSAQITLLSNENTTTDFINYYAGAEPPECGNGIREGDEECDGTDGVPEDYHCTDLCLLEKDEKPEPPGNGGGGGGGPIYLTIFNEQESILRETTVTITWQTNLFSTSQVIYSAEGEPHTLDENNPPYYGYAHATPEPENPGMVTVHSVTLTNLTPGTTYYYRAVSHASPPEFSYLELSFTTPGPVVEEKPSEEIPPEEIPPVVEEEIGPVVGPVIPIVEAAEGEIAGEEVEEEFEEIEEEKKEQECSLLCGWREWLVIILLLILLAGSYHLVLKDSDTGLVNNNQPRK